MVSGFLTSPNDQDRIISGEASWIRIESKSSTTVCCLNNLSRSFIRSPQRQCGSAPSVSTPFLLELDVDAERADFLDEHVEGLGHTRIHHVVAVHYVLVHLGATRHVVRLDRQHFLQRVGSPIGLERPDFHLAEALPAAL